MQVVRGGDFANDDVDSATEGESGVERKNDNGRERASASDHHDEGGCASGSTNGDSLYRGHGRLGTGEECATDVIGEWGAEEVEGIPRMVGVEEGSCRWKRDCG